MWLLVAVLMVAFAVLLPFASRSADGVQNLVANSGDKQQPIWNGIMASNTISALNPYVSSLIAGLLGIGIVLIVTYAVGATVTKKK